MQTNNKRNLIILLIAGAALYIFRPAILGAVMQPNNSIPYVAPQPATQPAYSQPLYTAPDPAQQPQPQVIIIATSEPVLLSIYPTQPAPVIIEQVPVKDWSEEITAVNRNLQQATKVVEACAAAKVDAAFENPPRLIDCGPAAENLMLAKGLMQELQDAIREGQ
jgi:hypothetical protein